MSSPGLDRDLVVLAHFLRGQRAAGDGAARLDLGDPLADQLGLDRLGVDLLHDPRRLVLGRGGDRLEPLLGVLEAGPDALQVEDAETTELAGEHGGVGTDHPVHRRGDQRQVEAVGAEGPADVNVVRVAGAARRNDRDVVESVSAPPFLSSADFDFQIGTSRAGVEQSAYTSAGTSKSWTCDLTEQPLDLVAVDDAGAEVLGRLGAAGDAIGEALLGSLRPS